MSEAIKLSADVTVRIPSADVREDLARGIFRGFDVEALRAAFSKVQNRDGWKLPIRVMVPAAQAELYVAAIDFMVGGPTVKISRGTHFVRLENRGYYVNIGA
jgi:hypothetical protein